MLEQEARAAMGKRRGIGGHAIVRPADRHAVQLARLIGDPRRGEVRQQRVDRFARERPLEELGFAEGGHRPHLALTLDLLELIA